jgi:hypothetical protein
MCTVSWLHQRGGYHLLVNRDEKRTRAAGLGPRIGTREGVRFIAPADGDFGGTWVAANELGVAACLLNGNGGGVTATRSRGFVIRELIAAESASAAAVSLRQLDLRGYAPFALALLDAGQAIVADWNGCDLIVDRDAAGRMPLISSSYDADGVCARRREEFRRCAEAAGNVDAALLYRFHTSHGLQPGPYSPCMHRTDAHTVSLSWVIVSREEIRFLYLPGSPCTVTPGEQEIIERAA